MAKKPVAPAKPAAKRSKFRERLFLRHIRNEVAAAAVRASNSTYYGANTLSFDRARGLVDELDDDTIVEVCEDEQAKVPQAVGGPIFDKIVSFIVNMDPALRQAIVKTILSLLGLNFGAPETVSAGWTPARAGEVQNMNPGRDENGEVVDGAAATPPIPGTVEGQVAEPTDEADSN